jgi:hypothetical protein
VRRNPPNCGLIGGPACWASEDFRPPTHESMAEAEWIFWGDPVQGTAALGSKRRGPAARMAQRPARKDQREKTSEKGCSRWMGDVIGRLPPPSSNKSASEWSGQVPHPISDPISDYAVELHGTNSRHDGEEVADFPHRKGRGATGRDGQQRITKPLHWSHSVQLDLRTQIGARAHRGRPHLVTANGTQAGH